MTEFQIPSELVDAISNEKLVIFVGSGLSKRFNLPDWNKMTIDLINEISDPKLKSLIPTLENGLFTPIEILEKLKKEHTRIHRYIKENFIIPSTADLSLHRRLLDLSGKIITTNYDNAFEKANEDITTVIGNSPFMINELKNESKYIFKIHGCSKDASKCVIFKEDYDCLYGELTPAAFKLSDLFANNTFLFIGFSLQDPYVTELFERIDKLFQNNNKHFILSTNENTFNNFSYLRTISLTDFRDIDQAIDSCLQYRSQYSLKSKNSLIKSVNLNANKKIAVLYPEPIDIDLGENFSSLLESFNSIDAELYEGFLNVRTLQQLDDFACIFIFTKCYKNNLYIEAENLKSQLIGFDELKKNILNDKIVTIFITDIKLPLENKSNCINIVGYRTSVLKRFIFKALRNSDLLFEDEEIFVSKDTKLITQFAKGSCKRQNIFGFRKQLPFVVKSKLIVGRVEEQLNIADRIIATNKSFKVVNVKGSGGIGKTSLIKKIASNLYDRGYFSHGITFITCETVSSYSEFEEELIKGFKLFGIVNFKEYLNDVNVRFDLLIILDNFETICNLENRLEYEKILQLIEYATSYASIVITSREKLLVDFEDTYTLPQMNTDDAIKLFVRESKEVKNERELKILRIDVLENLLNNNPLAIKLVSKTAIFYKSIEELKNHLENNFFQSTSEEFAYIYNKDEDINIQKTKSIYQSINYSYCKLQSREKLAFEILHLFPDGISFSNFKKCFKSNSKSSDISELDLRHLIDKSLVENTDGYIQLQPIIRRFAEHQFLNREDVVKRKYYSNAYSYNSYVLKIIREIHLKKSYSDALKFHDFFKNNLLGVFNYLEGIDQPETDTQSKKGYFLRYVLTYQVYVVSENHIKKLENKLDEIKRFFSDVPDADLILEVIKLKFKYYHYNFNEPYRRMSEMFSPNKILNRVFSSEQKLENEYKNLISGIHSMEGHTLDYIVCFKNNDYYSVDLSAHFFYLGVHHFAHNKNEGFYKFEIDYAANRLNEEEIDLYIKSQFSENHLEIMQCNYVISKVKPLHGEKIKKLVVTNPYTKGIKELMFAFFEQDIPKKINHFKNALTNLHHIKYYYLEALYFYCALLHEINDSSFEERYNDGLNLAKKCHYQYLEFRFNNLKSRTKLEYKCSLDYYSIVGFEQYISKYNTERRKYFENIDSE